MLAIGRALMTNPRLLLLDEATEGLAPLIRHEIWSCIGLLKREGLAMIVVDKNIRPLLPLASRHHVIERGRIAAQGTHRELLATSPIYQEIYDSQLGGGERLAAEAGAQA